MYEIQKADNKRFDKYILMYILFQLDTFKLNLKN